MRVKFPETVKKVIAKMEKSGYQVYVVGGAVRDVLTGVEVKDWDFTTDAKPEEIQKLFKDSFYDNAFGTVGIAEKHLGGKGDEVLEITTFRSESSYSDHRRPDRVVWGKSLKDDLKRRDFTINAMALRPVRQAHGKQDQEIVDPFDGQKDLDQKLVRAVGEADKRFKEDALRMMRAIRIAAQLGFGIEEKTLKAIEKNSKLIKKIAYERIRDEWLKIIASPYPKDGVLLLFTSGLLEHIVPELIETRGVDQAGHHTKDVWNHSLDSLQACPADDPIIRMATLLHDIGKPASNKNRGKGKEITFYNHEVIGARMVKVVARRLKMSKKQIDLLWLLVRWHMFAYDPKMTDKAIRRFVRRVGVENIDKMMMLRAGDRVGGGTKATSWRLKELQQRVKEVLHTPMQIKDMKVNGNDVMKILKIKGGPKVGRVLKKLFEEVMKDSKKNDRKYLLKRVKDLT
ncbi:CCA tRNA nucleotidyltransferase [Patescibacteria group bacterium]